MTTLYKPKIYNFPEEKLFYRSVEDFILDNFLMVEGDHGSFRFAISGGSTPLPIYKNMANNPAFNWEKISLYLTDERYVDFNNKESNYKNIIENLGKDVFEDLRDFVYFDTNIPKDEALKNYNENLEDVEEPFFDFTLLGAGKDGHIASLFPGGDYFSSKEIAVETSAGLGYETSTRFSLTLQSILSSRTILLILKGEEKLDVINEVLKGDRKGVDFPIKFLLAHPNFYIYYCEE